MTVVQGDMPRKPGDNTAQVAIRVPEEWLTRCDSLIPWIARPGVGTTRTDVIRAALARGLDALEQERAAEHKKGAKR